jgi:hypothetical protein
VVVRQRKDGGSQQDNGYGRTRTEDDSFPIWGLLIEINDEDGDPGEDLMVLNRSSLENSVWLGQNIAVRCGKPYIPSILQT